MNNYILKNLLKALALVSLVLAAIIFLTQSIKFLELVISAGAASGTFWLLTLLALPRFLEVILPISMAIAAIFIYFRMMSDQELTILRASGFSPMRIAKPALMLSGALIGALWIITLFLTPQSMRTVESMQHVLKAEFSSVLFQEGVFNRFGDDITVFIRERGGAGELRGLMIHDKRERNKNPVTITAKGGQISVNEDGTTQVTVYEGSRQDYNPETKILNRLNFERYQIDLPNTNKVDNRWRDANERTTFELFNPDMANQQDIEKLASFRIELHRRFLSPLIVLTFLATALPILLLGPQGRQGLMKRALVAGLCILLLQALYLGAFNIARKNEMLGLGTMYIIILCPILISAIISSRFGENLRQSLFYKSNPQKNISEAHS